MRPVVDRVEAPIQHLPFISCYLTEGGSVCRQLHSFIALDRLNSLALDEQQTLSGDVEVRWHHFLSSGSLKETTDCVTLWCSLRLFVPTWKKKKHIFFLRSSRTALQETCHSRCFLTSLCGDTSASRPLPDSPVVSDNVGAFFPPTRIIYLSGDPTDTSGYLSACLSFCPPAPTVPPFDSKWLLLSLADEKHG